MKVPVLHVEGRPYIDVMGLETVLRDMALLADKEGCPDEAVGIERVLDILTAVVRREPTVLA